MGNFILISSFLFSLTSIANTMTSDEWLNSRTHSQASKNEIRKFSSSISDKFADTALVFYKNQMIDKHKSWVSRSKDKCPNITFIRFADEIQNVPYSPSGSSERNAIENFESGMVQVESSACISNVNVDKVFSVFMDPKFQKDAIEELQEIRMVGENTCENVKVPMLGRSHYCYKNEIYKDSEGILIHNWVVSNAPLSEAETPTYYREVLVSVHQVGPNVAIHINTIGRGVKINSLIKGIVKKIVLNKQSRVLTLLNQRSKRPN